MHTSPLTVGERTLLASHMSQSGKVSLGAQIEQVKSDIRREPGELRHRVAYFQLLCVAGDWERASDQIAMIEELDSTKFLFAQAYSRATQCELERRRVFTGTDDPVMFGEPTEWSALLIEGFRQARSNHWEAASKSQSLAFEAAPETPGAVNGAKVTWIADADARFGPVLEVFLEGHYRWIPFMRISRLEVQPPKHLIDLVWTPVKLTLTSGVPMDGLVPTRYFGSEADEEDSIRRSERTEWREPSEGVFCGIGHRLLCHDEGDISLGEVREFQREVELN